MSEEPFPYDLSDVDKAETLRVTYSKLYEQNHFIRKSAETNFRGGMTLGFALIGWSVLLVTKSQFTAELQTCFALLLPLLLAVVAGAGFFLYREFLFNCKMIVRAEKALRFYDKNEYLANDTLYDVKDESWGEGFKSAWSLVFQFGALSVFAFSSPFLVYLLPTVLKAGAVE